MTREQLREVARQQNEQDAEAGRCTRYVDDERVLLMVSELIRSGGDAP